MFKLWKRFKVLWKIRHDEYISLNELSYLSHERFYYKVKLRIESYEQHFQIIHQIEHLRLDSPPLCSMILDNVEQLSIARCEYSINISEKIEENYINIKSSSLINFYCISLKNMSSLNIISNKMESIFFWSPQNKYYITLNTPNVKNYLCKEANECISYDTKIIAIDENTKDNLNMIGLYDIEMIEDSKLSIL